MVTQPPQQALKLGRKLHMRSDQRGRIKRVIRETTKAAKKLGQDYLASEQALEAAFSGQTITPEKLAELTRTSARLRAELRLVHLRAHLLTAPLLAKGQRHRYGVLQGYKK